MQNPADINIHWLDLSTYGNTPSGLPLYRVVWADSRTSSFFHDDTLHFVRRYEEQPAAMGHWLLEKWLPPQILTGMTREEYADFFAAQGFGAPIEEYPSEGDYELVLILKEVEPAKVRLLIERMEHRLRTMTLEQRKEEVKQEHMDALEAKKVAKREAIQDIFAADVQPEKTGVIYG